RADGLTALKALFGGLVAKGQVQVRRAKEERPFRFDRDIETIFVKRGCDSSSCHGGPKGRGGFKLSLDAVSPRQDYKWIVEGGTFQVLTADTGPKVPRVNLKDAEKSLLLLKPTLRVPHAGGTRLEVNSPDYRTILKWIRNGVPYGKEA